MEADTDYEIVSLIDVSTRLHIGIADWERHPDKRQRVSFDVHMKRSGNRRPSDIAECLDYDRLFRFLTTDLPARPHVDLLETLAADVIDFCLEDSRVESVKVVIRKLDVYNGMAVSQVEIGRSRIA